MGPIDLPVRALIFRENLSHQPRLKLNNFIISTLLQFSQVRALWVVVSLDHQCRILSVKSSLLLGVAVSRKTPVTLDAHEVAAYAGETCRKRGLCCTSSRSPVQAEVASSLQPRAAPSAPDLGDSDNAEGMCQP